MAEDKIIQDMKDNMRAARDAARGTLLPHESHPCSHQAVAFVLKHGLKALRGYLEAFYSVAMSGDRMAEICAETLRRVLDKEPVSDRYILGLAWAIREMEAGRDG